MILNTIELQKELDAEGVQFFTARELVCKCCGVFPWTDGSRQAVHKLEAFRRLMARPVTVHSAYRCPRHNKRVGGAPNSYHLLGRAFDVSPFDLSIANSLFSGIGRYDGFIHMDNGPLRRW